MASGRVPPAHEPSVIISGEDTAPNRAGVSADASVIRGVAELEAENQELRRQLALYEKHVSEGLVLPRPREPSPNVSFPILFVTALISSFLTGLLLHYLR